MRLLRNLLFKFKPGLPRELIGCDLVVDASRPWLALLAERLDIVAPASANPLWCYVDTVIFYEHPARQVAGGDLAEHGRITLQLQIDDVIETPHGDFRISAGRVRWSIDHWEMVWTLRRQPPERREP